jgi:hypothetical protein
VDYDVMLGAPVILLGALGFLVAGLRRSSLGDLGALLVLVTLPLTAIDFTGVWYIPHRTVFFLGIGLVLLGGVAVGGILEGFTRAVTRERAYSPRKQVMVAGVVILLLLAASVPVGQATPNWYRYYSAEEYAIVETAVDVQTADPSAVILAGAWQPNLFVRALGDEHRVKWAPHAFTDHEEREAQLNAIRDEGGTAYVLADSHTMEERGLHPDPDRGPLQDGRLDPVVVCCEGHAALYRAQW